MNEVYQNLDNIPATASSQQMQSGIVVIDNKTGDVVAVAGGVGEKQGSLTLNRATQSYLSPGSTIKPVSVYAPALELGLVTPATVMDDTPYSFTDARHWPKNSDSVYRGLMNINEAVKHSINTIPVKLVAQMTPEYCFEFAKEKMGLSSLVSSYVNTAGDTFSDIDLAPLAMGGLTKGVSVKADGAGVCLVCKRGRLARGKNVYEGGRRRRQGSCWTIPRKSHRGNEGHDRLVYHLYAGKHRRIRLRHGGAD